MCAQDSIVIIWLSTVDFETDAVGVMVCEQCPAPCPFTLFLAFNVTLLPLTFCAGLTTWKLGGTRAGLHLKRISTSFGRQRSLGEFPHTFLKLLPARKKKGLKKATGAGSCVVQRLILDTHLKLLGLHACWTGPQ